MKFNKKITSILTGIAILSAVPYMPKILNAVYAEETDSSTVEEIPDFTYSIKDGEASINYVNYELTEFEIPTEIEGCPVTSLGDFAFLNSNISSITIPEGIRTIGKGCFEQCPNLTEINLPDTLESIGDTAFRYCTALKSFNMPDSVTEPGKATLLGCTSLETVKFSNNIKELPALRESGADHDGVTIFTVIWQNVKI